MMNNTNSRRLNIKSFLLWAILMIGAIIISVTFGFMPWGPEGILAGLGYFVFLAFIGYLIEKSGLGKFFGEK